MNKLVGFLNVYKMIEFAPVFMLEVEIIPFIVEVICVVSNV